MALPINQPTQKQAAIISTMRPHIGRYFVLVILYAVLVILYACIFLNSVRNDTASSTIGRKASIFTRSCCIESR